MHANDMLKYKDKIIEAFKDFKKSDDAVYDYVLENVNDFIQKIKLMSENIDLSLFSENYYQLIMQKGLSRLRIKIKTKKL